MSNESIVAGQLSLEEMQNAILLAGWQFHEHMFNDGNLPCLLEFTRSKLPQALSTYPRPKDCIGWGRFGRRHAWEMAYNLIILGIRS